MNSNFLSPSRFLVFSSFITTLVFIESSPVCLCSYDGYSSCSNLFNCGEITNVGFPFWGDTRPDACGNPQLKLNCEKHVTTIEIVKVKYRVLDIDSKTKILKIIREDYSNGIRSSELANTTFDSKLFEYVGNLSVMVEATKGGFDVRWKEDTEACSGCIRSKGVCGYDLTSNHTTCYCPNQSFGSKTCPSSHATLIRPHVIRALEEMQKKEYSRIVVVVPTPKPQPPQPLYVTPRPTSQPPPGPPQPLYVTPRPTSQPPPTPRVVVSPPTPQPPPPTKDPQVPPIAGFPQVPPATQGSSSNNNRRLKIAIGISAGVAGIIVLCFVIICYLKRDQLSSYVLECLKIDDLNDEEFMKNYGSLAPKRYTYSDVKKLTNSFTDKVGQGGYGAVYKGKLPDGHLVAVKVLSESKGNGEEFINEVASISKTSHVNIVSLLGYCHEKTKRALIYEFMPNGSLDKFIYKANSRLEWKTMYQIALGVARGLEYLHRGCTTRILHFDIKPHNILLDEDLYPKISDFGLAKLCKIKESIVSMTGMRGTAGYIAPEVFNRNFGGVSHKSDVYSYGMLVLEMVGGRKNYDGGASHTSEIYFPHWIYKKLEHGENVSTYELMIEEEEEETARKMMVVSLWCIQTNPLNRPSMGKVIEMLEGTLESLQFPPKPFLDSPTRSSDHSVATS